MRAPNANRVPRTVSRGAVLSAGRVSRARALRDCPARATNSIVFSSSSSSSTSTTSTSTPSPDATEAARATAFPFEPAKEVLSPTKLSVSTPPSSKFPPWLRGTLWRVGPGCFPKQLNHLFDGYAMAAKVSIRDDKGGKDSVAMAHQQRFLETRAWRAFKEKEAPCYSEFGTPAPLASVAASLAKTALGLDEAGIWTDNASVTIRKVDYVAGEKKSVMLAASESVASWILLDGDSLETLRNAELDKRDGVAGDLTCAHAQPLSRSSRTLVNIVTSLGPAGESVVVLQDTKSLVRTAVARLEPRPLLEKKNFNLRNLFLGRPWVHEFPCAGGVAVVPEGSLPMDLLGSISGAADHFLFSWEPGLGTRYHVVDLRTSFNSSTSTSASSPSASTSASSPSASTSASSPSSASKSPSIPTAPFFDHPAPNFYFHVVNSFLDEEANEFVFDVPSHSDAKMIDVLSLENLRSDDGDVVTRSRLTRVRVPLRPNSGPGSPVRVEHLFDGDAVERNQEPFFFEFPTPNPRFRGDGDYRFAWGLSAVMPTSAGNALSKVDIGQRGKERVRTWHEPGCLPGEPLMIPRRRRGRKEEDDDDESFAEDDGVVLSLVVGADGGSFLLVLDAATMEEVARARLAENLPYGFHCTWIEDDDEGESEGGVKK